MTEERILNKIKKCLALSASNEPAEAAVALRQAQKLMEMHGISQLDLKRSDLGEARVRSKASVSRIKDWELAVMYLVTKAFGCELMWVDSCSHFGGKDVFGCYILLGLKSQVEVAQYTAEVMLRRIVKARAAYLDRPELFWESRAEKSRLADSFCIGWSQSVAKTVHAFAMSDELSELIRKEKEDQVAGRMAKHEGRELDGEALDAGREAGASESIHRPLNEAQPTLRIGS